MLLLLAPAALCRAASSFESGLGHAGFEANRTGPKAMIRIVPFGIQGMAHSGIKVPLPRGLSVVTSRYGFRGILRSVTDDLVTIERLGRLHEIIVSRVRRTSDDMFSIRTETPKWLGRKVGWKKYI